MASNADKLWRAVARGFKVRRRWIAWLTNTNHALFVVKFESATKKLARRRAQDLARVHARKTGHLHYVLHLKERDRNE